MTDITQNLDFDAGFFSDDSIGLEFDSDADDAFQPNYTDEVPRFLYRPFDLERPGLRLLRLFPTNVASSPIRSELFQAWFDVPEHIMPYEALSYTWGAKEETKDILINNQLHAITENVYLALLHMCQPTTDRVIWVDALCIDQRNNKERPHQVGIMGNIYSKAESVIVWLGSATYATDVLMRSLRHFQQATLALVCNEWLITDPAWQTIWDDSQKTLPLKPPDLYSINQAGLRELLG